jgi:hypothetical protein
VSPEAEERSVKYNLCYLDRRSFAHAGAGLCVERCVWQPITLTISNQRALVSLEASFGGRGSSSEGAEEEVIGCV